MTHPPSPVLAATDLSAAGDAVLRQGQAIASSLGLPFVVCHVLPEAFRVRVLFPQHAGIDSAAQGELEDRARAVVAARVGAVAGHHGEAPAIAIESGTPHGGVLAAADRAGAGLIVVGYGATALRVARSAHCPTLVARPSPEGGCVLGATDFSDPALPAVQLAAAEAARRNARLRLLHCLDIDEAAYLGTAGLPVIVPGPPVEESVVQDLESAARQRLTGALTTAGADGEVIVSRRRPASGIVDEAVASGASLIVVGSRGRTGLARLALGSTAEDIVRHAPCSVLVVPLHPEA
jgi:nucleotide-binding universal stress UspA family protein